MLDPNKFVARAEFDSLSGAFERVNERIIRADLSIERLSASHDNMASKLNTIVETLEKQDNVRRESDKALRRVIWAANMLGPKSLALAALLVSLLYEWLRR